MATKPTRRIRPLRPRHGLAFGLVVGAGAAFAQAEPTPSADAVETVIVTAEKRETKLQKTPTTISVINGDALARRGATTLNDIAAYLPNVAFSSNIGASQIYIRGIGNTLLVPGSDPGVAFYSDGAYVSDQWATNVALFDMRRIEVLRGPQGSLYGRNATGGAINVISAAPTEEFEGRVGVVAGEFGQFESEGFVSGPVSDGGVLYRLSYQVKRLDGFSRDELGGVTAAPDRVDALGSEAVRLQLLAPIGDATLKLIAGYYHQDDNGPTEKTLYEPFLPAELLYGATPSRDPRSVKSQIGSLAREIESLTIQYDKPTH